MAEPRDDAKQGDPETVISTLEMILDHAIVEGARLKLPFFVSLLRLAREELDRKRDRMTKPGQGDHEKKTGSLGDYGSESQGGL